MAYAGFCHGKALCSFFKEPTGSEIRRYHPGKLLTASQSPPSKKNCDASTYQSNNFCVSHKHFKPSTPGSILLCFVRARLLCDFNKVWVWLTQSRNALTLGSINFCHISRTETNHCVFAAGHWRSSFTSSTTVLYHVLLLQVCRSSTLARSDALVWELSPTTWRRPAVPWSLVSAAYWSFTRETRRSRASWELARRTTRSSQSTLSSTSSGPFLAFVFRAVIWRN